MTQPQYRYDGFISYRHHPRDMKIAAKLMSLLEKMSTSDKRRLRIFRDQSELPTSDNLGNDIHTALAQSRFLIILGSPSYLQSKWCMEEVRYFRKLHGDSNHGILPILIEGEPRDALPEYLFQQTETFVGPDGNRIVRQWEVEPLCADVRGRTDAECLRKLRSTEYLRIAAPMLGCRFDDLYQRSQRQKRRRIGLLAAGAVMGALVFAAYNNQMLQQIHTRQQALYLNEGRRIGTEALKLSGDDPAMAMLLADAALPENLNTPDRPIAPQAEQALRSAVLQAQIDDSIQYFSTNAILHLGTQGNWELSCVYPEIQCFTVCNGSGSMVFDLISGEKLLEAPGGEIHLSADGKKGISMSKETVTKYDETGPRGEIRSTVYYFDLETGMILGSTIVNQDVYAVRFDRETGDCYLAGDFQLVWDLELARDVQPPSDFELFNYRLEQPKYGLGKFSADGSWTEQALLPDLSQERYQPARAHYYTEFSSMWFGSFKRDLTQQEETVIDEIEAEIQTERPWEYSAYGAPDSTPGRKLTHDFTPDGKLMMVYYFFAAEKNAVIPYNFRTYFYSTEESKRLGSCEGLVYSTPVEGILLHQLPDSLRILSYHPENFGNQLENPEVIWQLSLDGSRMIRESRNNSGDPEMVLCEESGSPLYHKNASFRYALPDFSRVLFTDRQEKRETVVYDSNGNEIASRELPAFDACCMNEDGTKVAFGNTSIHGPVQIWDLETNQIIFSEVLPYSEMHEFFDYEMQGDYLLFNSGSFYVLWNWKENCLVSEGDLRNEVSFGQAASSVFSQDGLVFIQGDGLGGIYDLKQNRAVSFDTVSVGSLNQLRRNYKYCADSGILVVQSGDTFLIQSRNALGDFETRQRIKSDYPDMKLSDIAPVLNTEYLVISNGSCCEVYHMPDGNLTLRIENPEGNAEYGLIGKELVDLRILDGGPLRRFPIPTTEEARSWAADYLESARSGRSLTPEELDNYFIPGEW